ncbi:MAG: nucleotidyltransferase family protein [Verrucomicrobiaceae bacterium]|nr:MAG: nucleotidyltransferase family protein [Verrucomicrobiaceae bacterium]
MKIGAVVLAAGGARRFGSPKQLPEIEGETLVDRACRTALEAGCAPVLRVLGAHAEKILERACPAGTGTFVHSRWDEGMGSTLAAGTSRLLELEPELDAILVLLADQPVVTVGLLKELEAGLPQATVVWCRHADINGPPALFSREHFDELRNLQGDRGAKAIAAKHAAATVLFPDAGWDIDSPETWQRFLASRR